MATQTIDGHVEVKDGSKERVAYDLMIRILNTETGAKDRDYYLTLFSECYRAVVYGWDLKTIRTETKR
jgi:hypothetical protein